MLTLYFLGIIAFNVWLLNSQASFSQSEHFETSTVEKNRNNMRIASELLTLAEVSRHDSRKDCWIIIHDKVYDVTKFLEEHPGGEEVLLASTGKDATNDFEDIGHSNIAKALMNTYYVGDIDRSTIPARKKYTPPKDPKYNQDKTSESIIRLLQFLLPLFVLAFTFSLRSYTKSSSS